MPNRKQIEMRTIQMVNHRDRGRTKSLVASSQHTMTLRETRPHGSVWIPRRRASASRWNIQLIATIFCFLLISHDTGHIGVAGEVSRVEEQKHVLFVSLAMRVHATPLLRIAEYMVSNTPHRITFATHDSGESWVKETGAEFMSAGPFPVSASDLRSMLQKIASDSSTFRGVLAVFQEIYLPAAQPLFDALVSNVTQAAPDIIVFDVGTIGAQYLVEHLSVPYVVNSPTLSFDLNGEPSYVPSWGTGFALDMSLWGRCMNVLFPRLLSVALTPSFMQVNKQRWELGLPPYRSQHEIFRYSRMILNTAFGLEYPRPLSPLLDLVGPILPAQVGGSGSLPPWLSNFVQGDVVYVSLGSMTYLESWQVDTLIHGLNNPEKYRVLWSISLDQRRDFPATVPSSFRIKSLGTAAHFSMLANPSIRIVVSHCGLAAAQEALYFGNPVLCIPFMMDQPDVAARVVDAGVGIALDKSSFTVDQIQDSIRQLTSNVSFAKRAASLGDVLQRAGGAKQAAKIIETTMTSGWEHLKSTNVVAPWHKTIMLDVWAVYMSIVFVFVALTQIFISWLTSTLSLLTTS